MLSSGTLNLTIYYTR